MAARAGRTSRRKDTGVRRERNRGWTRDFPPNGFSTQRAHSASSDRSNVCLRIANPAIHRPTSKRSATERGPGRQRRHARAVRIDRAETLLQHRPINRSGQPHQLVAHVDDLVEPDAEQILLTGLAPLA